MARSNNRKVQLFQAREEPETAPETLGQAELAKLAEGKKAWKAYSESIATKPLGELLSGKPLFITQTPESGCKSPKGWPMLIIGDPAGDGELAKNTIGAINAIVDYFKYRDLKYHVHIANFDPSRDAEDVKMVYTIDPSTDEGHWTFYSWINGSFRLSKLNYVAVPWHKPSNQWTEAEGKRANMLRKHDALDQIIRAVALGNKLQVVMNLEGDMAHYQQWVHDLLEVDYATVQEKVLARWSNTAQVRQLNKAGPGPQSSGKASDERMAQIAELAMLTNPVNIKIQTIYTPGKPVVMFFDPSKPDKSDILNRLINMSPENKILGFEAVE